MKEIGWKSDIKMRDGYDHGYFFVSSFMEEHVDFHARFLNY